MKNIEFDVELAADDLFRFSMRHTYGNVSGIFGLVISLSCWVILAVRFGVMDTTARIALFIIGCLFTIVQPVMLYSKSKAQARQNKDINAKLHYTLLPEGITVSQGEQEASVKWYDVRKVTCTAKAVYVYMSPVRAFIFPQDQCGEAFEKIKAFVAERVKAYADYDPAEPHQDEAADRAGEAGGDSVETDQRGKKDQEEHS